MQKYLYVILKEKKYDQQKNSKWQKSLAKIGQEQESQQSRNLSYLSMEEASSETARSSVCKCTY